jgi:hypothetical protein
MAKQLPNIRKCLISTEFILRNEGAKWALQKFCPFSLQREFFIFYGGLLNIYTLFASKDTN